MASSVAIMDMSDEEIKAAFEEFKKHFKEGLAEVDKKLAVLADRKHTSPTLPAQLRHSNLAMTQSTY